jgi:hypothetical protein
MPKTKGKIAKPRPLKASRKPIDVPDTIRREYAGKYVAWTPDGRRIVAVGRTFDEAERKADRSGYPIVAIARIPLGRTIG